MLMAPVAYPNTSLARATAALRRRTRISTRMASLYRSSSGGDVMPAPASEDAGGRDGPPAQLHFADDVLLGHHPPVAAVRAVVPMVAHHEVIAFGNDLWSPVVVAAVLGRDVVVA